MDGFLWKFLIFPTNFLNLLSNTIKTQEIIKRSCYSSQIYTPGVLCDSKVSFLGKEEGASFFFPFFYCVLFKHIIV